jgi:hypothetical protein
MPRVHLYDAPTSEPVYVKVTTETVFAVSDPSAVTAAAVNAIGERSYSGTDARAADVDRARRDVAFAVQELCDPGLWAERINGIAEHESSIGAFRCSSGVPETRGARPDFGSLYATCECDRDFCDVCGQGFQLTARTAAVLNTAACQLADFAYDDIEHHGDAPVTDDGEWAHFDRYPRVTRRQDALWRRQAARAADDLADDLESGRWPTPRCIAEEMLLQLIVEDARAMLADDGYITELTRDLPTHRDDYDFPLVLEALTEDDDLSQLFAHHLDGIEDPDSDLNQGIRMGDYRPPAWFDWFGGLGTTRQPPTLPTLTPIQTRTPA